jgi:SulP family sulfate permease
MQGVNQCDFSGIHMLEAIRSICLERGGDLYLMKVQNHVQRLMETTGFYDEMGADHFLTEDDAIGYLFYKMLDPAICVYECNVRAFAECKNLPKRTYPLEIPLHTDIPPDTIADISAQELRLKLLNGDTPPIVIDVREPREFKQGHIPQAQLIPLPTLVQNTPDLTTDREIIVVCRGGRRSARAAYMLQNNGYQNVRILRGGILAWEAAGLLEAVDT